MLIPVAAVWWLWRRTHESRSQSEEDAEEEEQQILCEKCGYDLRGASRRCPECGTFNPDRAAYRRALSSDWPLAAIAMRNPAPHELTELAHSTWDATEAHLVRDQLIARGMPCFVDAGGIKGEHVPGQRRTIFYRVMIYEEDADSAKAYITRVRESTGVGV